MRSTAPPGTDAAPGGRPARLERGRVLLQEARRTRVLHLFVVLVVPLPFLLVAHQLHRWEVPGFLSVRWNVNNDRSVIEVLGYAQVAAAVTALLVLGLRRRRGRVYTAWGLALVVLLLDDALRFHEHAGALLTRLLTLPEPVGLKEQHVGELLAWAGLGVVVLLGLAAAHRTASPQPRHDSRVLVGLVGLLMVFAVVVDAVHSAVKSLTESNLADVLIGWLEASGELMTMTALLAYAVHVLRRDSAGAAAGPVSGDFSVLRGVLHRSAPTQALGTVSQPGRDGGRRSRSR